MFYFLFGGYLSQVSVGYNDTVLVKTLKAIFYVNILNKA